MTSSTQNISFTSKDSKTTSSLTPETYMTSYFVCVYIFFSIYYLYYSYFFFFNFSHINQKPLCNLQAFIRKAEMPQRTWLTLVEFTNSWIRTKPHRTGDETPVYISSAAFHVQGPFLIDSASSVYNALCWLLDAIFSHYCSRNYWWVVNFLFQYFSNIDNWYHMHMCSSKCLLFRHLAFLLS